MEEGRPSRERQESQLDAASNFRFLNRNCPPPPPSPAPEVSSQASSVMCKPTFLGHAWVFTPILNPTRQAEFPPLEPTPVTNFPTAVWKYPEFCLPRLEARCHHLRSWDPVSHCHQAWLLLTHPLPALLVPTSLLFLGKATSRFPPFPPITPLFFFANLSPGTHLDSPPHPCFPTSVTLAFPL